MRILLIGKFPPIEGGVSGHTFWLARALASQGHIVDVVTNADECEPTLTQLLYGNDSCWLQCPAGSSALRIHQTIRVQPASFIPFAEPFVSKLFGLSLSVLEEHGCDVILGWYFEPYGVVAGLVGQATGRPFVVRHAGSDLGRLALHPQLAATYQWTLRNAAGLIVTNERQIKDRFGPLVRPRVPIFRSSLPDVFFAASQPLDIAELLVASSRWFASTGLPTDLIERIEHLDAKPFAGDVFTIGIYGKVGASKGSFDLLEALKMLAESGSAFAFLSLSCGRRQILQSYYEAIVSSPALAERSWILPPIGPWRIPAFVRRCDAVCFLERDFPIAFHGPLVPREVLSAGACLICSREVAEKPVYHGNLVDDRNVVIIDDPRDHVALADRLSTLIAERDRTRSIGGQGQLLARFWNEELPSFYEAAEHLARALTGLTMLPTTN